jgi:hypothetical protein
MQTESAKILYTLCYVSQFCDVAALFNMNIRKLSHWFMQWHHPWASHWLKAHYIPYAPILYLDTINTEHPIFVNVFYKYSHYFKLHTLVHYTLLIKRFIDTLCVFICISQYESTKTYLYFTTFSVLSFHVSFHYRLINLHSKSLINCVVYKQIKSIIYIIVMLPNALHLSIHTDWNSVLFELVSFT